jgi:C-terminal processing protease CtpA/Prc
MKLKYEGNICSIVFISLFLFNSVFSQVSISEIEGSNSLSLKRTTGVNMLNDIKDVIKQYYYDKKFRGIDLDERFKLAKEKVKTLESNAQIFRTIAQVLLDFHDSHTKFYPPNRSARTEYGFAMQMIGQNCFIVDVKKGSDAEAKGLRAGDQILAIDGYIPFRERLWIIEYILYRLDPREIVSMKIKDIDDKEKTLEVKAKIKTLKDREKERDQKKKDKKKEDIGDYKCKELSTDLIACKLKTFVTDKKDIDKMMQEIGQHRKLILDLRGNSGGYVSIEEYLTGFFFDKEVKIASFITRDKVKDRIAKSHKGKVFGGELIVLIDSDSASASEVFSRMIQIEKRGKVLGDVSSGAVMTSYGIPMSNSRGVPGYQTLSFYSISVTVADLVMSDGNRLEGVGVIPDLAIGPTNKALFNRYDPVLAHAAKIFGTEISQEAAGGLYFLNEKPEEKEEIATDDDKK